MNTIDVIHCASHGNLDEFEIEYIGGEKFCSYCLADFLKQQGFSPTTEELTCYICGSCGAILGEQELTGSYCPNCGCW